MLRKKLIILVSATALAATALIGVAYAWFTSETSAAGAVIDTGILNIALTPEDPEPEPYKLYPQFTEYEYDTPLKPDGDVAEIVYNLENNSSRPVLAKIRLSDLLAEGTLVGSKLKEDGVNVDYDENGPIPDTNMNMADALPYLEYLFEIDQIEGVNYIPLGENLDDIYIYLPKGAETHIRLYVWLNQEAGNEYQNAEITLAELSAKATQYRRAALESVFTLNNTQLADIEYSFGTFE